MLYMLYQNLPSLNLRLIQGSSSLTSVKIPGEPRLEGERLLLFPQLLPHPLPQEVTPSATQRWPSDPAGHTKGPPESPWTEDEVVGQGMSQLFKAQWDRMTDLRHWIVQ